MDLVHSVYEPAGDGPFATVIALHGWGASAQDLAGLAPHLGAGRVLMLSPQGPVAVPIGPQMVGYGWYRLQPGQAPDPAAFDAALGAVIGFIDQATRRYPIDPARLAVVGFSQGGSLAYACGLHHRPRFAAVAALSSWLNPLLLDSAVSLSGLPLLIQHGSRDELVQVERGREAVEQLRATGAQVVYREYDMGHEINAAGVRDLSEFLTDHLQLRRAGR